MKTLKNIKNYFSYSQEVLDGLINNKPIIALESTILTHGLPKPLNFELAIKLENIIRSYNVIPAHLGILNGIPHIGLSYEQLQLLSLDNSINPLKISKRDLAPSLALKRSGGTTVSGTLSLAHEAGIKLFVTGGLGGVHRRGELTWDVSNDLIELGRNPISVICAGAKSILDTGRTLEYLETQGVTVATIGKTKDFPAFYTPKSGFYSPYNLSIDEAAKVTFLSEGIQSGQLYCAPIPDNYIKEGEKIQKFVNLAIKESEDLAITGKEVTPWLLSRVAELTKGSSVKSNLALIENNAHIGSQIAVAYNKLCNEFEPSNTYYEGYDIKPSVNSINDKNSDKLSTGNESQLSPADIIVIGASAIDITSKYNHDILSNSPGSTFPGNVTLSTGGVARNIAEASSRVLRKSSMSTLLLTPVGNDEFANILKSSIEKLKMRTDGLINSKYSTPIVNLVLSSDGQLREGVASFEAVENLTINDLTNVLDKHNPKIIALDANINSKLITDITNYAEKKNIDTLFEPTSVAKCLKIFDNEDIPSITYATPNVLELKAWVESKEFNKIKESEKYWESLNSLRLYQSFRDQLDRNLPESFKNQGIPQMCIMMLPIIKNLIVKCGSDGVFIASKISKQDYKEWDDIKTNKSESRVVHLPDDGQGVVLQHMKSEKLDKIINSTGAGDSFVGTLISSLSSNKSLIESVKLSNEAAVLTLGSNDAVSVRLNQLSDDLKM